MAAVTDFADVAAAQAAGYTLQQTDRGAGAKYDRYVTQLDGDSQHSRGVTHTIDVT